MPSFSSKTNKKQPINVKTVTGNVVPRSGCIKVAEGWIEKDHPDIITIDGEPYWKNSKLVLYDFFLKTYVDASKITYRIINGIVGINNDKTNPITFQYGYFKEDRYNNVKVFDHTTGGTAVCMHVDLLDPSVFSFSSPYGVFVLLKKLPVLRDHIRLIDHRQKGYSIEDNVGEFEEKMKMYEDYKPQSNKNILPYALLLGKNLTYGVETETISGYLPNYLQWRTGTVICRDGSLTIEGSDAIGAEYVTVPMRGLKGLYNIQYLMTELSKICKTDLKCSMHIHFGGFSTDRAFLIALYNLCFNIQDEIFKMFPYYKTKPDGIKHKNYNQKLSSLFNFKFLDYKSYIDKCYNKLFYFLSGGAFPDEKYNRKDKHHPSGSKWNIQSRYYWVNFVNTIFSKRNTVEFRLHTPTTNYMKTIIWLFMCNAIIKFAESNQQQLITGTKFTLKDVFDYYSNKSETGKFVSEYLWEYYKYKVAIFEKDLEKNDYISMHDITNDHKFEFTYKGIGYWF